MFITVIPYTPLNGCHVPPHKPLLLKRDRTPYCFLFKLEREATHRCPSTWGVWFDKKHVSPYLEIYFWRRVPAGVPKQRAKHIEDLTKFIERPHVYPVAYGGFSDVWSCYLRRNQSPPEKVAVKAIRSVMVNEGEYPIKKRDVKREYKIWAKLRHQNIIPLYGIAHGFGQFPAFVCPWAENGTLTEYLEKFEAQLDMRGRLILLADIATGLQYLHSQSIVHGDLSGANVLITDEGRACLADFGLSTLFEHVSDTTVSAILLPGNIRWAAPELFEEPAEGGSVTQLSSPQADVYSFGSIMLQTLSGKLPFYGVYRDAQIVIMISRGDKPPRERRWDGEVIPDVLWDFIRECWKSPSQRPTGDEIVAFIDDQISRY